MEEKLKGKDGRKYPEATAMQNPFTVPRYFAQNQANSEMRRTKFQAIWNGVQAATYLALYVSSFVTLEERFLEKRYGFISKMKFAAQYYEMNLLLCAVVLVSTLRGKKLLAAYFDLASQHEELKKLKAGLEFGSGRIALLHRFLFGSSLAALAFDAWRLGERFSPLFYLSVYFPGLCASVFLIQTTFFYEGCEKIFRGLNEHLDGLCMRGSGVLARLAASKEDRRPRALFGRAGGDSCDALEMMFRIHDGTCEIARAVNEASGAIYFAFTAIATTAVLSLTFDLCMDVIIYSRGGSPPEKLFLSLDYWALAYALAVVYLIKMSTGLAGEANSTRTHLHRVGNLYPRAQKHVSVPSLRGKASKKAKLRCSWSCSPFSCCTRSWKFPPPTSSASTGR